MQKYTVKLLLRKAKATKAGKQPIYIRITIDRKSSFISTGHYIMPKFWDEKSEMVKGEHADATEINQDLTLRRKEVLQNLIDTSIKGKTATSQEIKKQSVLGDKKNNFFHFAESIRQELSNKREDGTLDNYRKHLLKLEIFHGSKNLNFEDITVQYLTRFENYLCSDEGVNRRKQTSSYAHAIMKNLRKFFRLAVKRGVITYNPFNDDYEMPEYTAGDKDHLTLKELDRWTKFYEGTEDPFLKEAALYFLFGCYSGLRISDWFLFDMKRQVHAGHIALRAKKNGEWVSIPMHNRLKWVLGEMKKVPLRSPEPNLNGRFKQVAKAAKIEKHISSHCGRKTFAVTMCLERGISSETAAELMGITLATFVNAYSRVTPQKIRKETAAAWAEL